MASVAAAAPTPISARLVSGMAGRLAMMDTGATCPKWCATIGAVVTNAATLREMDSASQRAAGRFITPPGRRRIIAP